MTALVLPVGALIGTFHDAGSHHHEIRLGGAIHELSDAELAAWAAAHGPPDGAPEPAWTRAAVEAHLAGLGLVDSATILGGLAARGLLVELDLDTAEPLTFARSHRAVPMLYGLGNSADEPWLYSIGLLGREMVQVTRPIFELWAWAHLDGDLWQACETFAEQERAAGGTEPEVTDPARVLTGFLTSVHGLLNVQAVHLDSIPVRQ